MSYHRDLDLATRGVGAIAAADASRARHRRRVQVGRATQRRDQVMAAIAQGALGKVATERSTVRRSEPVDRAAPVVKMPPETPPVMETPPILKTPPDVNTVIKTTTTETPPYMLPPRQGPTPPGVTPVGLPPVAPLPPMIEEPLPDAAEDHTIRNMVLIGGGVLLAYLLFGRKGAA
jgi:hypothetical protein